MSTRRVLKQTSYAVGFLVVVLIVVVGLVLIIVRPEAPQRAEPTPTFLYKPIAVEQVDTISQGNTVDIVARLRNPNPRAGSSEYPVTFVLLNSDDDEFARHEERTYLLPGSIQYVIALSVPQEQTLKTVRIEIPEFPALTELPSNIDIPTFGSFPRERGRRTVGNQTIEEQKGIIRNTSTFDFQRVGVVALAESGEGKVIGVGKTFVGELKAGEQREVTVQWPAPTQDTSKVVLFPATNVFLEDNIIRVIGDPSLPR